MIRNAVLEDIDEIYNLNTELFIVLSELKKDIYNPIGFPKEFITSIINSNESDYIVLTLTLKEKTDVLKIWESRFQFKHNYYDFSLEQLDFIEEAVIEYLKIYLKNDMTNKIIEVDIERQTERELMANIFNNFYNEIKSEYKTKEKEE